MKKEKSVSPQKLVPLLKNKYTITFLGFLAWLSFFDRNDFITTHAYQNTLESLKKEMTYYEEGNKKNLADLNNLLTDHQNLIKYARENYLMKKDNEDIYVFEEEPLKEK